MAFNFLTKNDFSKMEAGKYEIDKSDIYALVQSYETKVKEKGSWEGHRRYLDIQYMVEGIVVRKRFALRSVIATRF